MFLRDKGKAMEFSHRFFENKDCKYYPCHNETDALNCLFCYCPLYPLEQCPGDYTYIESNGKPMKNCMDCTFPHKAENYDIIIEFLSK